MKLTILVDNYVEEQKLRAEHGLAILIEDGAERILFDCGQSDLILANAKIMGVDLNKVTRIVLSHGHFDHTGGLLPVLKHMDKNIDIHAHPLIFEEKFSKYRGFNGFAESRYIGIPEKRQVYEKKGARFLLSSEPVRISDDIYLTGQINKDNSGNKTASANAEEQQGHFFIRENNIFVKDPLDDDISIFINLQDLLVIITGCAHSGIINILKKAEELKFADKSLIIAGGLHLAKKDGTYIDNIITQLKKYDIKLLVPAHCTGTDAYVKLKNNFNDICIQGKVGKILEF